MSPRRDADDTGAVGKPTNGGELGRCPYCGETIPAIRSLIEYEVDDETRVYAECPDCLEIVHPE